MADGRPAVTLRASRSDRDAHQGTPYAMVEGSGGWCFQGFLNTLSSFSTSVSTHEACAWGNLARNPLLERDASVTHRDGRPPVDRYSTRGCITPHRRLTCSCMIFSILAQAGHSVGSDGTGWLIGAHLLGKPSYSTTPHCDFGCNFVCKCI